MWSRNRVFLPNFWMKLVKLEHVEGASNKVKNNLPGQKVCILATGRRSQGRKNDAKRRKMTLK